MKNALLTLCLVSLLVSAGAAADQTLLLRQPNLSAEKLAFVYAGDIWVADRDGANPRRLTSSPVEENRPVFSSDGSWIAFAASFEGNVDVYVIPTGGGQPRRLTWHPSADVPTGWTPDGSAVTMVSSRERDHGRSAHLYHVSVEGGLPEKQMEARIYRGVYDQQGKQLAYIAFGSGYNGLFGGSSGWKGYRGGTTPDVQIMDLEQQTVATIPGEGATNFNPFWLDGAVFFLSDREGEIFNLFRYDTTATEIEKISSEDVWDIRAAHGFGSSIVYEAGGRLKHLDLTTGEVDEIVISIFPDLPQLRSGWKDAKRLIEDADISPTGKRAVVTARGDIFTLPVDEGSTRNLTGSVDVREYTALWSPEGDEIAYISDDGDGQVLVIEGQTGTGEERRFELGPSFYYLLEWGGGEKPFLVYQDNHLSLYAIDLESGESTKIATGARRDSIDVAISPDGRWLAYTKEQPNFNHDLMLYNFASGTSTAATERLADIAAPAFSRDGKYLYFAASTNSGPIQVGLNMTSQERPYRAGLYALVLSADGNSPLLPISGDEGTDEDDKKKEDGDENGEGQGTKSDTDDDESDEKKDKSAETRIDFAGLTDRVVALPVAERNYADLGVAEDGDLYYVQRVQPGASNAPPGRSAAEENALVRFDFEEKEATSVLSGVRSFAISADGKHMIIQKVNRTLMVAEIAKDMKPEPLELGGLKVHVDPRQEWAQIFDDVWRMEKEFFYAPNMHGLVWQAVYDRYRPLVDHVGRREDLNTVLVEMIAEMQVGHNRVGGGDVLREQAVDTGLLGANLTVENDRYRIAKIYTGEAWNPFYKAPLAVPGNRAKEGEYLLAVNGQDLFGSENIFARLQGTVGEQVSLTVGPTPDAVGSREIVVEPIRSERMLRLWSWIEENRRFVEDKTDGRVGYIYLPNTAGAGYTYFNRMFFAQVDKDALIIDERSNGGGQAANYITEVLSRIHLSGWKDRDGLTYNTPAGAMHGPKVMLIDQDAGSGGDYLPYSFRHLGIGKLIGTRTWGGLIGISTNPRLIDGGFLTVPFFRFFDADGTWSVENEGVAPDIEVALDPIAANQGRDTQLERAIDEVLGQLEAFEPTVQIEAPAFPTELGK